MSCSLIGQHHVNHIVLKVNRKAAHRDVMILWPFTGPHIVPPPMPGAFDEFSIQ